MAKLYGQLAGTLVQTLKSGVAVTSVPPRYKDSRDGLLMRDYAALNGNVIGDQISLGSYRSTAWFDQFNSIVWFDALGATCTYSLGDATHPAGLRAATVFPASASFARVGLSGGAPNFGAVLWQRLGWASDPGGQIELLATFGGANPANGNFGWEFWGRT